MNEKDISEQKKRYKMIHDKMINLLEKNGFWEEEINIFIAYERLTVTFNYYERYRNLKEIEKFLKTYSGDNLIGIPATKKEIKDNPEVKDVQKWIDDYDMAYCLNPVCHHSKLVVGINHGYHPFLYCNNCGHYYPFVDKTEKDGKWKYDYSGLARGGYQ